MADVKIAELRREIAELKKPPSEGIGAFMRASVAWEVANAATIKARENHGACHQRVKELGSLAADYPDAVRRFDNARVYIDTCWREECEARDVALTERRKLSARQGVRVCSDLSAVQRQAFEGALVAARQGHPHPFFRLTNGPFHGPPDETCNHCGRDPRNVCHDVPTETTNEGISQ